MTWTTSAALTAWAFLLAAPAAVLAAEGRSYARTEARYAVPDVELVDRTGETVAVRGLLDHDGPVVLQFVFTTCPAVCPLLTAPMAALPGRLGAAAEGLLRVSVSIDPDHDRPERLAAWARRFEPDDAAPAASASSGWRVLTGSAAAVGALRRAFDAASADKSEHRPLTFVRGAGRSWLRLEGFPSAGELAAEVRAAAGPDLSRELDLELGRRIYQEGVLPSGEPLTATVAGAPLTGAAAACALCHRPSGYGDSEGGLYVPPITGAALAAARRPATVSRGELLGPLYQERHTAPARARLLALAPRPGYDAGSLAAAVRDGRDAGGRALDPAMPRYRLGDRDAARLARYLLSLGSGADPGVDERTVHLATVVTPGAGSAAADAMLTVIDAYTRHRNADVDGFLARPGHSPWHRDELAGSLRSWRVHVWRLSGPPDGWTGQLRERHRARPVFAVVAGLGGDDEPWQPVHAFCEAEAVPCLFPSTGLPGGAPPPHWTVYPSAGVAGEARALAAHLAAWAGEGRGPLRVTQVYRDAGAGRVAAGALREALASGTASGSAPALEDRALAAAGPVELPATGAPGEAGGPPAAWVLWLGEDDLAALDPASRRRLAGAERVYLSGPLAGVGAGGLSDALGERLRLTWPFALPGDPAPRSFRVRAWMRSRGVALTHERLQLATHYALSVADAALGHLVDRFSRQYFLERVEHEAERGLDPGLYPRVSLGPGQRIASKGCYVLRPDPETPGGLAPDGGWIVP